MRFASIEMGDWLPPWRSMGIPCSAIAFQAFGLALSRDPRSHSRHGAMIRIPGTKA